MLRILIIDDEPLARQHLRQLLSGVVEVEIAGEADSLSAARRLIEKENPDAIFLDIQMPRGDGFSLLRSLERPPKVVFVTAHPGHAVEAFDFEAVDYLLKPVKKERFDMALDRLRTKIPSETLWQEKDRICFKTPQRTLLASTYQIVALEADGDFTRIFIEKESPVLICHPLSYYEKILPSPPFLRLDRSLMIHRDRVKKITPKVGPQGRHHETLNLEGCETSFSLGRAARRRLTEALKE